MKFMMFCIHDVKSGIFLQPFVSRSENDAKRMIASSFEDPNFMQTPAGRYPHEFLLFSLAGFDDESGIISDASPKRICMISDLRPVPPSSTVPS